MTTFCGIDLHSNNSLVVVLDEADRAGGNGVGVIFSIRNSRMVKFTPTPFVWEKLGSAPSGNGGGAFSVLWAEFE